MQLLRAMAVQPNRAVIVVTHDSRIYEFADRIINMEDGRLVSASSSPLNTGRHAENKREGKT